jgi:hypothetical protein
MIGHEVPYRVLLPKWIWEQAADKDHFKKLVLDYMRHYPHYAVISVKSGFAICNRK